MESNQAGRVLVVNMNALIKADITMEATVALLVGNPLRIFRMIWWLFRGLAFCKEKIASEAPLPDMQSMPCNEDFLQYLRSSDRKPVLVSSAHRIHAEHVAGYFKLFSEIVATEKGCNLVGRQKAERLAARFGEKGFDYAGCCDKDKLVWAKAATVITVNAPRMLRVRFPGARHFDARDGGTRVWLKALRPHNWMKNLLIFIAVIGGHQVMSADSMSSSLVAFVVFGLLSSSSYLINDVIDISNDRPHPRKRTRPLAAGEIGVLQSCTVGAVLVVFAALLSLLLPPAFAVTAITYLVATLAYSFKLKKMLIIDVITLAMLFSLRILAGGAATGIELTFWLLAFSTFIFLSLAILKRYADMQLLDGMEMVGRPYTSADKQVVVALGIALGVASVLLLALYIDSDIVRQRYSSPYLIWLILPLIVYWISRAWILGGRGQMSDDPLFFALRDRTSWIVGTLVLLVMYLGI